MTLLVCISAQTYIYIVPSAAQVANAAVWMGHRKENFRSPYAEFQNCGITSEAWEAKQTVKKT